jgi:VWFA-related protein
MPLTLRHLLCIVLLSLLLQVAGGQNPTLPAAEQQPIQVNTTEVLLDVLVKDKKDRPVRDLKPEEIEVYEDGVKQTLDSVRLISLETEKKGASKNGESRPPVPTSLQEINLVTLVFDHFDAIHTQSARSVASNYLDKTLNDHMFVRVMVAGSRLYVIEQFTNDRKKLERAIANATVTTEKSHVEASDRITNSLKGLTQATPPSTSESIEITLARLTLNTLEQAKKAPQVSKAAAPIFSLLYVARAQQNLAGRKIVVYFANRPYIQPGLKDVLQTTISEANRGNVSFYAVDVPRAIAGVGLQSSRLENPEVRSETTSSRSGFFDNRRSTFLMFEGLSANKRKIKWGT